MRKPDAVAALARCSACQPHIRDRVYEFWKDKRKQQGKPSLRRLQVPSALPSSPLRSYFISPSVRRLKFWQAQTYTPDTCTLSLPVQLPVSHTRGTV